MQALSHELDYKKLSSIHPTYGMTKVYPQNGPTLISITNSGGPTTTFEIPAEVINLKRSYLSFNVIIPETYIAATPYHNYIYSDSLTWIRQMEIRTRGGVQVMNLDETAHYTKVIWKSDVKQTDLMTFDTCAPSTTLAGTTGASAFLQRSNAVPTAFDRPTGGAGPVLSSASSIAYTENLYLMTTAVSNGAGAGDSYYNVNIPLKLLKNTICEVDKNIYAGEPLLVRITWSPSRHIYFAATNDPVNGQYTGAVAGVAATISNPTLYVATETNSIIASEIRERVATIGFQFSIPYVYTYVTGFASVAATTSTTSIKFNRGQGHTLQKIYYSLFNQQDSLNTVYDNNNVRPATAAESPRITSFRTLLNNMRLQEVNLDCKIDQDYKHLASKLRGSVVQNSNIYHYNQFWVDDFCEYQRLWDTNSNLQCGLDLTKEQKWDIYLNIASTENLNHMVFAVLQRNVSVTKAGLTCE